MGDIISQNFASAKSQSIKSSQQMDDKKQVKIKRKSNTKLKKNYTKVLKNMYFQIMLPQPQVLSWSRVPREQKEFDYVKKWITWFGKNGNILLDP
jgi:hypothetical protein